jgi:hypothetical protein
MDRVYIHGLIQKILNKEFSNTQKEINDFVEGIILPVHIVKIRIKTHTLREVMFI